MKTIAEIKIDFLTSCLDIANWYYSIPVEHRYEKSNCFIMSNRLFRYVMTLANIPEKQHEPKYLFGTPIQTHDEETLNIIFCSGYSE